MTRYQKNFKNSLHQLPTESVVINDFNNVFDIAHSEALTLITIKDDKKFLFAQREKGRHLNISPIDTKHSKIEKQKNELQLQNELE